MNSPDPTRARISIIGAGPGGLTCARILQRHGIPVTVHDRDRSPDARDQGGTLDLHADNGQIALREAGLLDAFFALARPEGQEMRQMDPSGAMTFHHVPEDGELFKPEIDRGALRALLLDSLEPGTVHWGQSLEWVEGPAYRSSGASSGGSSGGSSDGAVGGPADGASGGPAGRSSDRVSGGARRLHFADGSIVETDLVIGADGAFSRVRPAVSPAVPEYSGVSFLEAWFSDVENRHPEIADLVGAGGAAAADGDRGLFAQRNGGDRIRVYIIRRVPADWIAASGLDVRDTAAIRARLLDEYAHWSPRLRRLITDNDGRYVDRPIYALPVPHTWPHDPAVTLLGDAAHLMPPLGVGVNLAMLDACELALALADAPTIADAVRAYEATMLPRSTETAKLLDGAAAELLSADLPDFANENANA